MSLFYKAVQIKRLRSSIENYYCNVCTNEGYRQQQWRNGLCRICWTEYFNIQPRWLLYCIITSWKWLVLNSRWQFANMAKVVSIGNNSMTPIAPKVTATDETLLPHERWPQLLEWQVKDEIQSYYTRYRLVSIRNDGYIFLKDFIDESLSKHQLTDHFMTNTTNKSAADRAIKEELQQPNEYMELLSAFHDSIKELKARDAKLLEPGK
jgi:hypothetical protein